MPSDPSPIDLLQIDAFADRPFAGNPAAVCLLERAAPAAWMQAVAAEMNLSETAFVVPADEPLAAEASAAPSHLFGLRWFTPAIEVDLCGHATLASAAALVHRGLVPADSEIRFATRSGQLTARCGGMGVETVAWLDVEIDLPLLATEPAGLESEALDALGVSSPRSVERTGSATGQGKVIVELESAADVLAVQPDFRRLAAVGELGWIVTARAGDADGVGDADFVSRFFGPALGVDEDPVTGSAHAALVPFWSARLGRAAVVGFQASARGGRVAGRIEGVRALLSGRAQIVLDGRLLIAPPA
ncbi:MAG: PhzF family phenazine biosynthesis protein [Acidobacteriota bacterium]